MRRILFAFLLIVSCAGHFGPAAAQDSDAAAGPPSEATTPAQESAQALIEVLQDEAARAALIQELERLGQPVPPPVEAAEPEPKHTKSLSRRIAEASEKIVEGAVGRLTALGTQLLGAPGQLSSVLNGAAAGALLDAAIELALLVIATVAVFLVLRRIGRRIDRKLGARAHESGFGRTLLIALTSLAIDILVVLAAWASGYVVATLFIGPPGDLGIRETMYLNAFLVVEMVKVALRTILSPNTRELRPVPIPDRAAKKLNVWLSVVVSVLGYGQLLFAPIVAEQVSFFAGQSMVALVALVALIILTILTLGSRAAVADWLLQERHMAQGPRITQMFARKWHWPLMLYLIALFVIVLTRPGGVLLPVLGASAQIIGAIVGGSMAAHMISRSIASGIHLPENVNQRLPFLEQRLNSFVPKLLILLRLMIGIVVFAFALQSIGVFDFAGWLEGEIGARAASTLIAVLLMVLATFGLWLGVTSYIDYRLNPDFGAPPSAREKTLLTLGKNAFSVILIAISAMFILSEIGIDIAPLIASAGVLGLAIGFGAQKMVQDIITGVFIQFENAINVGDVITVGGTTGTVEALTIRSVSLRDVHGVFHIIPFSSVDMVSNYMRGFGLYVIDMGIAYREDINEAKQAMFDAFAELRQMEEWGPHIIADLDWMGLTTFGDSAIVLRARVKCLPGKQWAVGRAYNAILKRVFDERSIEIPFPHQTVYFGEDKEGKAPPVFVSMAKDPSGETSEAPETDSDRKSDSDPDPDPDPEADDRDKKLDTPDSEADAPRSA